MRNLSSPIGPNKKSITNIISSSSSLTKTTYIILRGKSGMQTLNGVPSPRYAVVK
jgi:hypothetical protein